MISLNVGRDFERESKRENERLVGCWWRHVDGWLHAEGAIKKSFARTEESCRERVYGIFHLTRQKRQINCLPFESDAEESWHISLSLLAPFQTSNWMSLGTLRCLAECWLLLSIKLTLLSLSLSLSLSSRLLWCVAVLIVALFLSGHYLSCSLACSLSLSPRWYFCAWLSDDITLSPCYFCALLSVLISLSLSLSLSLYLSISPLGIVWRHEF